MTRDIAAAMITVDRSPDPNYLSTTLTNLRRSDLLTNNRLCRLIVADSGPGDSWARTELGGLLNTRICAIVSSLERRCANLNVAAALATACFHTDHWVLFLEDDIDVCANFFDSVGAWLDDHASPDYRIYAFGAAYPQVSQATYNSLTFWPYPIGKFYGSQCLALRSADASSLALYISNHLNQRAEDGTAYDLLMQDWCRATYPDHTHFLASAPSFVQHIGCTSIIRPRPRPHTFDSYPGPRWSYFLRPGLRPTSPPGPPPDPPPPRAILVDGGGGDDELPRQENQQ